MARYLQFAARRWLYGTGIAVLGLFMVLAAFILTRPPRPQPDTGLAKMAIPQAVNLPAPRMVPAEVNQPPVAEQQDQANMAIAQALAILHTDPMRIIEVRDRLAAVLAGPIPPQTVAIVKAKLSELAQQWLFGPAVYPGDRLCQTYQVRPGDQLRIIAERSKVPYELLMEINKIQRPEALRAGQYIKLVNGPFHATITRSTFTMDIYLQDVYVCSFLVGLGKPGYQTPTGLWVVKPGGKLIKPQWTDPDTGRTYRPEDPDYPLGSRWIALEGIEGQALNRQGFAIHGTNDPNQIGQLGSRGCIRLHNGDAVRVYNMLTPGLSKVRVVD